MAEVGDRVTVSSKGPPRAGVVTATSGAMITVRWDSGGETSIIPGPGVLSVFVSREQLPSARTGQKPAPGKKNAAAKKAAVGKGAAAAKKRRS